MQNSKPWELSAPQQAVLDQIISSNTARYGGWVMELGEEDDPQPKDQEQPASDGLPGTDEERGFPAETPVKDMTLEQQVAYYRHQSRKHENEKKSLLRVTGGKAGDALKADLEELQQLRVASLTDSDRALAEARAEGEASARVAYGTKLVEAEFRVALAVLPQDRREAAIASLAPAFSAYVTDAGEVDTDKVAALASTIAQPVTGDGTPHNFGGQGQRHNPGRGSQTGIKAGAVMFAASRGKTNPNT